MIVAPRRRARLLAAVLVTLLLPALSLAQEPVLPGGQTQQEAAVHAWKTGYAKRMSEERLEHKERFEQRQAKLREQARKLKRSGQSTLRSSGQSARPARPEDLESTFNDPQTRPRPWRDVGRFAITPPSNRLINNRTGDDVAAGQSETSIVAFGDHLVAAWNDGQGFVTGGDSQGWATSLDGGLTWTDQGDFPSPGGVPNFVWTSDPVLAVNEKTGAFYFSALCEFSASGAPQSGVAVVKGRWSGSTVAWGVPVITHSGDWFADFHDKQWLVADSVSHRVFLTYSRFPNGFSLIEFQWADSALSSFSAPQRISLNTSTENGWVQGSRPVVDGDGRLYVVYYLIGQGEADFYRVLRSTNSGVSFSAPATAVTLFTNFGTGAPAFNRPLGVHFPGVAVDRSHGPNRGRLYLTWSESINWLDDIGGLGGAGNKSEVEPNNNALNATPATLDQTLRGNITAVSDVDMFALPLIGGQHLIAAADSTAFGNELTLRLLAGDGVSRLTFTTFDASVNPPSGAPSGWMFTAPVTGAYYLEVRSRTGTGGYRLQTTLADQAGERGRDQRDVFVGSSPDGLTWSNPERVNEEPPGFDNWLPELAVAPDGGLYSAWYDFHDAAPATNGGQSHVYLARSGDGGATWTTLGAVTDTLSTWTGVPSNIEPNQGDYISLFANNAFVWPCWTDTRRGNPDVFAGRVPLIPNGAQVSFETVRLSNKQVSIDWSTQPADTLTMRLYRSTDNGAFAYRDVVQFDAAGLLTHTDTTVTPGHGYTYRLGRFVSGVEIFYGQVSVFVSSSFPLSISRPDPYPVTTTSFLVNISLATNEPAELVLYDIAGRALERQAVNLGMGPHTVTFKVDSGLGQGLYFLRLKQAGRDTATRVHFVR